MACTLGGLLLKLDLRRCLGAHTGNSETAAARGGNLTRQLARGLERPAPPHLPRKIKISKV